MRAINWLRHWTMSHQYDTKEFCRALERLARGEHRSQPKKQNGAAAMSEGADSETITLPRSHNSLESSKFQARVRLAASAR